MVCPELRKHADHGLWTPPLTCGNADGLDQESTLGVHTCSDLRKHQKTAIRRLDVRQPVSYCESHDI